jgi:hypothetical protein
MQAAAAPDGRLLANAGMELTGTASKPEEDVSSESIVMGNSVKLSAGLFVVLLLSCTSRWEHTDELVKRLRCGMTVHEIEREARRYPGTTTYPVSGSGLPDFVVEHGGTRVQCFLEANTLRAVRVSWISEPMKVTRERLLDLCPHKGVLMIQPK